MKGSLFGGGNFLGSDGGIQGILARAGQAAKSGLTMDNKNFRKLDRGMNLSQAKSITGKSVGSGKTRRTGTMSRKSRAEEDFESMEIEEVEALIEKADRELKMGEDAKKKIMRQKGQTKKAQDAKLQPIEEGLVMLRARITMLLQIKDAKIPFFEKLPKDNQFYKHYIQSLNFNRMKEAAKDKAEEDKVLFEGAVEKLTLDHDRAD